jgi:hypothetical protein
VDDDFAPSSVTDRHRAQESFRAMNVSTLEQIGQEDVF